MAIENKPTKDLTRGKADPTITGYVTRGFTNEGVAGEENKPKPYPAYTEIPPGVMKGFSAPTVPTKDGPDSKEAVGKTNPGFDSKDTVKPAKVATKNSAGYFGGATQSHA